MKAGSPRHDLAWKLIHIFEVVGEGPLTETRSAVQYWRRHHPQHERCHRGQHPVEIVEVVVEVGRAVDHRVHEEIHDDAAGQEVGGNMR